MAAKTSSLLLSIKRWRRSFFTNRLRIFSVELRFGFRLCIMIFDPGCYSMSSMNWPVALLEYKFIIWEDPSNRWQHDIFENLKFFVGNRIFLPQAVSWMCETIFCTFLMAFAHSPGCGNSNFLRRVSPLVWFTYSVTVLFSLLPNFSIVLLKMPLTKVCEILRTKTQLTRS